MCKVHHTQNRNKSCKEKILLGKILPRFVHSGIRVRIYVVASSVLYHLGEGDKRMFGELFNS